MMAVEKTFGVDWSPPKEWIRVRVTSSEAINYYLPICDWLDEKDRAGEWTLEAYEFKKDCVIDTYAMSDPDTAFEFKMRWG